MIGSANQLTGFYMMATLEFNELIHVRLCGNGCAHSFVYLFIYLFIYLSVYLFIYLFIYLFVCFFVLFLVSCYNNNRTTRKYNKNIVLQKYRHRNILVSDITFLVAVPLNYCRFL